MALHRLDLPTLTVETAWREFLRHRDHDRISAVMALGAHFKRVDERCVLKRFGCFSQHNPLDHTARDKVARYL
jgi:hypothetical protein